MKVGAIVQARMGSSRLPGKVMLDLAGKPVLWHVLTRTNAAKRVIKVVLATTKLEEDDILEERAKEWGFLVYRGSADDVLLRYVEAARKFNIDPVVRITADCPVIDPEIIDEVIEGFIKGEYDLYGISGEFPDGLDASVFSLKALEESHKNASLPSEREHIGRYIETHPEKFKIGGLEKFRGLGFHRWTIDEKEDYILLQKIYDALYSEDKHFLTQDILDFFNKNPELLKINSHIKRNEGLQKSLMDDLLYFKQKNE